MKKFIVTDKLLTPQKYLEIMTGKYFALNADNQCEEVEKILEQKLGEGAVWSHSLEEIEEVKKNGGRVVLVEIVNITDDRKQDRFCRWFEVPEDWTREDIINKMYNKYGFR